MVIIVKNDSFQMWTIKIKLKQNCRHILIHKYIETKNRCLHNSFEKEKQGVNND